jgi:hypothetical protein
MDRKIKTCPYSKPTNEQCFNCTLPDCYREEGRDEAERIALYRRMHPDKTREVRRSQYIKNREREIAYSSAKYQELKNNPEFRKERAEYLREYRAKKKREKVG